MVAPRLPDLYDPGQPLDAPSPLPIYHIAGEGGFVAKGGRIYLPSRGLSHLDKEPVRSFLRQALTRGAKVRRVLPGGTEWQEIG